MQTKIAQLDYRNPNDAPLKEAAGILDQGGLVIVPTETVYGVAASMLAKEAIAKLYEIKKRPLDKPFALLIERKDRIEELARSIPLAAYKLAEVFWPGPLTLILKSKDQGTVGVRMPNNIFTLRLIELLDIPLACPSANLSGSPAPKTFQEAFKDFDGLVEYALDGGDSELGLESTIVDLSLNPMRIVREGAIKSEDIKRVAGRKTVLFICTGNSCRSVMAQALLEKKFKEKNRQDVEVLSAGIMMGAGLSATDATKEVLMREGIDIRSHRSKQVTKEMIKKADAILVMEKVHEDRILQLAPEVKNRVFLLKEFAKIVDRDLNILDPIGRSLEFYEETVAIIKEAVNKVSELI